MNDTIDKIALLMAEEEALWKGTVITQTMVDVDVWSRDELGKLGYAFGTKRIGGQNVLMWGRVDAEQNFIEESRFESKVKQEFEAICKDAMERPLI
jgi:hypothetical protein